MNQEAAAVANILQTKADKCLTEQFWAVATVSAFNAALITKQADLLKSISVWWLGVGLVLITLKGLLFIWHRHRLHAFFIEKQRGLIQGTFDETSKPRMPLGLGESGVLFYSLVCIFASAGTLLMYADALVAALGAK